MASAVPVTGTLSVAASTATPPHRAWLPLKHVPRSCQAASSSKKMLATCQPKITVSIGKCVSRADPPTSPAKIERCACDMKNSAPNGYRFGSATRLIAGT